MISKRELDALVARAQADGEPMFESLDAMCEALGFDDATKEQMRIDMELTRPFEPGDTMQ